MSTRWSSPRALVLLCLLLAAGVSAGAWASSRNDGVAEKPVPTTSTPARSVSRSSSGTLSAPKASAAQDGQFLSDVTEADPALVSYEKKSGDVALRSLLTDGSAFCAFLSRDRDIDAAMVSVAEGARQVEPQTHLPLSVTTFNAVDAVALLTLCPSLQEVVPVSDMVRIGKLGATLGVPSNGN